MAGNWTQLEIEAVITAYFEMLRRDLLGGPYVKADYRRQVMKLTGRSDGSVEFKFQNISAILLQNRFKYIPGYKPASNFQGLLRELVLERLGNEAELLKLAQDDVTNPVNLPTLDQILSTMVNPPKPLERKFYRNQVREDLPDPKLTDYLELERQNQSLGRAGEEFVLNYERARLLNEKQDRLAGKVEWISQKSDGFGYDILSYEASGKERLIEVKTTTYGEYAPFYVTRKELKVSREQNDIYHLYRVYNFRRDQKMFSKLGELDRNFELQPTEYVADVG